MEKQQIIEFGEDMFNFFELCPFSTYSPLDDQRYIIIERLPTFLERISTFESEK